mmetsp:Transcript_49286/g.107322  ORF Transcript_49286/g.107322 Transcript_49286/m.107322 type:complete len:224 (+) Transcript_49286:45-716(+)
MRCFCCAESAESEMVLPAVRDRDDAAPISKAAIGSPTLGPTRKAKTFQVDLLRDETRKYGLDVSAAGKVCMVNSVQDDSLVADLNKALQEKGDSERIIRPFDRLLSFNGKEAPQKGKEVMEMLRNTHGSISILVQRPFIHKVVVEKTVDQLGISKIDGSTFLLVTNISDGVFKDHNASARPEDVLRMPARIVSVDGKKGGGPELVKFMEEASNSFELELLFYE